MIILFIFAVLIRLINLNQSFWLDEAAQVIESNRQLIQQFDIPADFHPPLYHLLLHFWMYLGKNEIWIRLLSVIFSILTIYLIYRLSLKLKNKITAQLVTIFLIFAPFEIYYAQEARPYALVTLLAILTTYFLINKKQMFYLISGFLLLYSSYLAPLLIIAHGIYIYFFEKKWFSQWLITSLIIATLFIPWISSFKKQLEIGTGLTQSLPGWTSAVSTPIDKALPLVFTKFMIGRISFTNKLFYGAYVLILFLIFCFLYWKSFFVRRKITLTLTIIGGLPILFAFLISIFIPVIAPQRLLFSLPFFYFLIASGITSLKNGRILTLIFFIAVSLSSILLYQTQPKFQREQWRQATDFVEKASTSKSIVLFVFPDVFAPWQWYQKGVVNALAVAPRFVIQDDDIKKIIPKLVTTEKIFYFHYLTELTDPNKKMLILFPQIGFSLTEIKDFPGVGFISIYERTLAYN